MKNVKDYIILTEESTHVLGDSVRDFLSDGWETYGQPFVFDETICQAMVLKPKGDNKK